MISKGKFKLWPMGGKKERCNLMQVIFFATNKAIHVEVIGGIGCTEKCVIWQTFIDDQMPKVKIINT